MPIAPLRWHPIPVPTESLSFIEGVRTMTTAGDSGSAAGMGARVYLVTRSMQDEYFYDADGEMLFVPQQGELRLWTEFGVIDIEPRGDRRHSARGEAPGRAARQPGPIGANCMANPRDFLTPAAACENREVPGKMFVK